VVEVFASSHDGSFSPTVVGSKLTAVFSFRFLIEYIVLEFSVVTLREIMILDAYLLSNDHMIWLQLGLVSVHVTILIEN
jgi:hypothetical protein